SPCVNSSMVATDGSSCHDNGIEANKTYVYTTVFKVLKSFPTVSGAGSGLVVAIERVASHFFTHRFLTSPHASFSVKRTINITRSVCTRSTLGPVFSAL